MLKRLISLFLIPSLAISSAAGSAAIILPPVHIDYSQSRHEKPDTRNILFSVQALAAPANIPGGTTLDVRAAQTVRETIQISRNQDLFTLAIVTLPILTAIAGVEGYLGMIFVPGFLQPYISVPHTSVLFWAISGLLLAPMVWDLVRFVGFRTPRPVAKIVRRRFVHVYSYILGVPKNDADVQSRAENRMSRVGPISRAVGFHFIWPALRLSIYPSLMTGISVYYMARFLASGAADSVIHRLGSPIHAYHLPDITPFLTRICHATAPALIHGWTPLVVFGLLYISIFFRTYKEFHSQEISHVYRADMIMMASQPERFLGPGYSNLLTVIATSIINNGTEDIVRKIPYGKSLVLRLLLTDSQLDRAHGARWREWLSDELPIDPSTSSDPQKPLETRVDDIVRWAMERSVEPTVSPDLEDIRPHNFGMLLATALLHLHRSDRRRAWEITRYILHKDVPGHEPEGLAFRTAVDHYWNKPSLLFGENQSERARQNATRFQETQIPLSVYITHGVRYLFHLALIFSFLNWSTGQSWFDILWIPLALQGANFVTAAFFALAHAHPKEFYKTFSAAAILLSAGRTRIGGIPLWPGPRMPFYSSVLHQINNTLVPRKVTAEFPGIAPAVRKVLSFYFNTIREQQHVNQRDRSVLQTAERKSLGRVAWPNFFRWVPLLNKTANVYSALLHPYSVVAREFPADTSIHLSIRADANNRVHFERARRITTFDGQDIPWGQQVPLYHLPYAEHRAAIRAEAGDFPLVEIPTRNVYNNDWFVVFKEGVFYHRRGEPYDERIYTCLVKWRDGHATIQPVRFRSGSTSEGDHILNAANEDITAQVELAFYGQQIVRNGRAVNIREIGSQFDDLSHLFIFPKLPDGVPYGFNAIYQQPKLIDQLLRGIPILLPRPNIDEQAFHQILQEAGYEVHRKGAWKPGQYQMRGKDRVRIVWRRASYAHTALGLTPDGHFLFVAAYREEALQRGATIEEVAQELQRHGAVSAILLANGADVLVRQDNEVIAQSREAAERNGGTASAMIGLSYPPRSSASSVTNNQDRNGNEEVKHLVRSSA